MTPLGADMNPQPPRRVTTWRVANGPLGLQQSARQLARLAATYSEQPRFEEMAERLVSDVRSGDHVGEARRLWEVASGRQEYTVDGDRRRIRYRREAGEALRAPDVFLATAAGDCDDQVLFLATALAALGHAPVVKVISVRRDDGELDWHVYVVDVTPATVDAPSRRIALDSTFPDRGFGWEYDGRAVHAWQFPVDDATVWTRLADMLAGVADGARALFQPNPQVMAGGELDGQAIAQTAERVTADAAGLVRAVERGAGPRYTSEASDRPAARVPQWVWVGAAVLGAAVLLRER